MPVAAHRIGVQLVMDQELVLSPLNAVVKAFERVMEVQKKAQVGLTEMVSTLRGAERSARALASAMEQVAHNSNRAGIAARGLGVGGGLAGGGQGGVGQAVGGSSSPGRPTPHTGSYVSPYSAAASTTDNANGVTRALSGPDNLLQLGYSPRELTAVRGSPVPMYGSSGPGTLLGLPFGPPPPGRPESPQLLLGYDPPRATPGTALATIPGQGGTSSAASPQGDSYGSGANFRASRRPNGYVPNFTLEEDEGYDESSFNDYRYGGGKPSLRARAAARARQIRSRLPTLPTPNWYKVHNQARATATEMAVPAFLGGEMLKSVVEASFDYNASRARLLNQGFSQQQADQAYNTSVATQRSVRGSSIMGNMDIIHDLMAVVQNPDEALKLTPEYAKLGIVLSSTGHGGEETAGLMEAIRAGEFRGVLGKKDPKTGKPVVGADRQQEIDTPALSKFIHEVMATANASDGTIGPAQIYQFLKSGGITAAMIGDEDLFAKNMAIIQAMGSARAGTGLQGFGRQFSAGKMSEASANLLLDMGVLNGGGDARHNKFLRKSGISNFLLLPGAMDAGLQQKAANTPTDFVIDDLLPKFEQFTAKHYGKTYTGADANTRLSMEARLFQQVASSVPGGVYMSEAIRNQPLIMRDVPAWQAAMRRDAYGIQEQNNPMLAQKELAASFKGFEISLGNAALKPAVALLDSLSHTLDRLADWAKNNPDQANAAIKAFAVGIAAFAAGTVAAGALVILTNPVTGLLALAAGMGSLGLAFKSIPTDALKALVGAAAGARFAGVPGAIAGGLAGGLWDLPSEHPGAISNFLNKTPGQALHDIFSSPAKVQKQSLVGGGGAGHLQPISITFTLDGKVMAKQTAIHMLKLARPGAPTSGNGIDYRAIGQTAGTTTL